MNYFMNFYPFTTFNWNSAANEVKAFKVTLKVLIVTLDLNCSS